jgi:ribosomal protein L29
MAIIRKKDLKRLGKKELEDKKSDLTMEILKIKSKKGQATAGSKKIKEIKKTIARINTQLREIK